MSVNSDMGADLADRASSETGPERQANATGEGLAAVAYALLEVAEAIREFTEKQEDAHR